MSCVGKVPGPNGQSLTVVTRFLQDHPYAGVAGTTETFTGGLGDTPTLPVSSSEFVYCDKMAAPGSEASATSRVPCSAPTTQRVRIPYLYKSVESGNDIDAARTPLPTVTTVHAFDSWGNPTSVEVTSVASVFGTSQSTTRKTTNTYTADTSGDNWILGRLVRATQDNSVPNVIGSVVPSAGSAPGATATAGTVATQSATLGDVAFGAVTAGSASIQSATLTNTGAAPLALTVPAAGAVTGTGFTFVSTTCGSSLGNNASCTVSMRFTPAAAGAATGTLTIVTGAGARTAGLTGTGVAPSVMFQPVSTNWGSIGAASDSGDWPVIRNNSVVDVLITSHAPASGPAGVWSSQGGTGYCVPGTTVLAPGASCTTFFGTGPLGTPGSYSAVDQVGYQVVGNPGTTFTAQQTYAFMVATTTAGSNGLAFGNVTVNTVSAGQTFSLTNQALNGGTLRNLTISVTGSPSTAFSLTHTCGTQLAAGASCQVTVAFTPGAIADGYVAAVRIRGGYPRMQGGVDTGVVSATGVDLSIPLTGNATAATSVATLTSGDLAFGNLIQYASAPTRTLTFRNDGNSPLSLAGWTNLPAALGCHGQHLFRRRGRRGLRDQRAPCHFGARGIQPGGHDHRRQHERGRRRQRHGHGGAAADGQRHRGRPCPRRVQQLRQPCLREAWALTAISGPSSPASGPSTFPGAPLLHRCLSSPPGTAGSRRHRCRSSSATARVTR